MSNGLAGRAARLLQAVSLPGIGVRDALRPGFSVASTRLVRALRAHCGDVRSVIDVGANVGQFALAALREFPSARVDSFEPVPDVAERLRRNLGGNPRATVHQCAVGRSAGTITFHHNTYSHVSSALEIHPSNRQPNYDASAVSLLEVPVKRLDDVLGDTELPGPVLLKLDAQGFEGEVLGGASVLAARVDWLVMEVSFIPLYSGQPTFAELDAMAEALGFVFVAPAGVQTGSGEMIIEMDALYRRVAGA